ncbi:MAG: hypothetical protein Q9191_003509 [Dirinaria sp. TL-2023a]
MSDNEDDLDDLDDILDEFSATRIDGAPKEPQPLEPGLKDVPEDAELSNAAADEFSKQLQEQMAALLGNVDETPEMRKEIENMMQELGAAADSKPSEVVEKGKSETRQTVPPREDDGFQSTIRKTMERMQNSGEQASAAAAAEDSDDIIAQMLKEMQSGGLDGAGGEEEFSKMLMGMMEQLTNKEILYEPMKELHDKFPGWMAKNRDNVKKDDLRRYDDQQRLVAEIVGKFEERGYSDAKAADREYIVERMQQMQAAGSPPPDLVGDMSAAQEALGNLDAGCPQQ